MRILDDTLRANQHHHHAMDEAIRTTQFIRNKARRLWMEGRGSGQHDLQARCAHLAKDFPFAARLNSMARQAAADRAWQAIARFYDNGRNHQPGKKGSPRFPKDTRSVEDQTSGGKLEPDGKRRPLTDEHGSGPMRLLGKKGAIESFPVTQIKRVRLLQRADGDSVQVALQTHRQIDHAPTGQPRGIDGGRQSFYTDSDGNTLDPPPSLPKAEAKLKHLHRRVSRTIKRSKNRKQASKRLATGSLKVRRQRQDFAGKAASALVNSRDVLASADFTIASLVKNHQLAKSSSDASWGHFLSWVRYSGGLPGLPVGAVAPRSTTPECSEGGFRVKKTLSMRTHLCPECGLVLDRDWNAALNSLVAALWWGAAYRTAGQVETGSASAERNAAGQKTSSGRKRWRPVKSAG
jgi:putative transposase